MFDPKGLILATFAICCCCFFCHDIGLQFRNLGWPFWGHQAISYDLQFNQQRKSWSSCSSEKRNEAVHGFILSDDSSTTNMVMSLKYQALRRCVVLVHSKRIMDFRAWNSLDASITYDMSLPSPRINTWFDSNFTGPQQLKTPVTLPTSKIKTPRKLQHTLRAHPVRQL